jgi:DNA-binding transcriptional LysR family regulator
MHLTESLRIFVRVAELASFSAAADLLSLPRTTVSAAVREAEAQLGTRLLHRTTRRVQLTQDGQVVFERALDLLGDVEELRGMFRADGTPLSGRLRVDMPAAIANEIVMPALPAFLAKHPALELQLSSVDRRVDLVREGFDCVLRVGRIGDTSLIARPLGAYRMVNVASPTYLKAAGKPKHLGDLERHRLVHYVPNLGEKPDGFEYVDKAGHVGQVQMTGAVTVNTTAAYVAAALAGLGIVQVPAASVQAFVQSRQLLELLPDWRAAPMPVALVYASRRHQPRRVQTFMDWLADLVTPRLQA